MTLCELDSIFTYAVNDSTWIVLSTLLNTSSFHGNGFHCLITTGISTMMVISMVTGFMMWLLLVSTMIVISMVTDFIVWLLLASTMVITSMVTGFIVWLLLASAVLPQYCDRESNTESILKEVLASGLRSSSYITIMGWNWCKNSKFAKTTILLKRLNTNM